MTAELTTEQIQHVLQGITIPPQPQVMVDLQMEQFSPHCTVASITKLISQDVGLSGSILKTVNSPFFQLSNKISSITQAVNILGVASVVNLVNAQSIRGALSDQDIISLGRFWDCAMEVAMISAVVAKQIGFPTPDEAYSLGLFHDCGVALLMGRLPDYSILLREAYAREDQCITDTENMLLNTNHAVVGYYIGKSWNLPRYLCEAIHEHHRADETLREEYADPKKKTLLAILKMSEHICGTYKILGYQDIDYEWDRIGDSILMYVGMSKYDFETMVDQITVMGLGNRDYCSL
jgi:HD-like signal output (HDOD) protein